MHQSQLAFYGLARQHSCMINLQTALDNWPTTVEDAVIVQNALRRRVSLNNEFTKIDLIAGVDVSYDIRNNISRAVVVTMRAGILKPSDPVIAYKETSFPYIPGFLSFREVPVLLEALQMLAQTPDLLMVDGQGIAHPRRFGIACHLGVLTGLPTIGVAKSRLIGRYQEPGLTKGTCSGLTDKNELIGTVLRSKDNTAPLFISPGHKIDHAAALDLVQRCLVKHRLPEPTRIADKISKQIAVQQPTLF